MPSIPPHPTLSALADLKLPRDIHISPDGTKVVYALESFTKRDRKATSSLWIADVGANHSARQITSGLFHDEKPRWRPDGNGIAFVSDRGNKEQRKGLYLLSSRGLGEAVPLTERITVSDGFEWNSEGTLIAFTGSDEGGLEGSTREVGDDEPVVFGGDGEEGGSGRNQRLRVVDVQSRTVKILTPADENVDLFSWSPSSSPNPGEIAYAVSDNNLEASSRVSNARIDIASIAGGRRTVIKTKTPITSLVWTQKDKLHFIARPLPPYTEPAVYEARIRTKQYGSYFGWTGEALSLHRARDSVVARIQNTHFEAAHALGVESTSWPFSSFFESQYETTSLDAFRHPGSDEFTLVIARSSPQVAHEVWSVSCQPGKGYHLVKLSSHNSSFDGFRFKRISMTGTDGWECDGWLFTPKPVTISRRLPPTVVLVQSHPCLPSFSMGAHLDVATLTAAGYAVLCPNIRNTTSPSSTTPASAIGDKYAAIIAILREAVSQNLVDESRVTISGWSEGGFLSSLAVIRNEFSFRAVVCGGGVVDWEFIDVNADPFWPESDLSNLTLSPSSTAKGRGRGALDFGTRAESGAERSVQPGEKRKTPLLILHGREDAIVPVSGPLAFWKQKARWAGPVQMVLYPKEGHVVRERKNLVDLWTRVLDFYGRYLDV
ncbi:Alpha/Beta hydrolase protein [Aspergillus crustosus]